MVNCWKKFPKIRGFPKGIIFSQASPDRRCSLCSLICNCQQEARLSAQTLTCYVLVTWKLWLVGTTKREAFPYILITQFLFSPPFPLNQPKGLVDREYYQIITTNNQPKALVDRVRYNLIISTNNHKNERSERLDGVEVKKKCICWRE